jgi:hypothetical protein
MYFIVIIVSVDRHLVFFAVFRFSGQSDFGSYRLLTIFSTYNLRTQDIGTTRMNFR